MVSFPRALKNVMRVVTSSNEVLRDLVVKPGAFESVLSKVRDAIERHGVIGDAPGAYVGIDRNDASVFVSNGVKMLERPIDIHDVAIGSL